MAAQQNNFWDLCRLGKMEELRELLLAGADPNTRGGRYNRTCLMEAIRANHEEMVDLLLAQPGIDVNAKDNFDYTSLHYACSRFTKYNDAILSKLLVVPGILLNERDSNSGMTPIMGAIIYGKPGAVRVMAAVENVDLDVRNDDGWCLEDLAPSLELELECPVCFDECSSLIFSCPAQHPVCEECGEILELCALCREPYNQGMIHQRYTNGGAAAEIVAILEEAREERKRLLVREQKNRVSKVLLEGIYDEDSTLHKLRSPNNVVNVAMPIVWEYLTWDWQVYGENQA